jgi:hypothetical protein
MPAGEERVSIVAGGVLDQSEVQPFAAVRASALAGEGAHNALKVRSLFASKSSGDAWFPMSPPLIRPRHRLAGAGSERRRLRRSNKFASTGRGRGGAISAKSS